MQTEIKRAAANASFDIFFGISQGISMHWISLEMELPHDCGKHLVFLCVLNIHNSSNGMGRQCTDKELHPR